MFKTKKKLAAVCIAFILLILISALKPVETDAPVKKATAIFMNEKKVLEKKSIELSVLLNEYLQTGKVNKYLVKKILLSCRIEYKKMEWVIAYYYPSVAVRINRSEERRVGKECR